ncbi:MAG TPA: hypothetical protein VFW30_00905 [Bryocella sp.]|nr:hypothetical protein [Bryocella sp.]
MTPAEQVDMMQFMVEEWKKTYKEMMAFRVALYVVRSENPALETVLDRLLEKSRNSPDIQTRVDNHFAGFEGLINSTGEGSLQKAIREFQERSGSQLPVH